MDGSETTSNHEEDGGEVHVEKLEKTCLGYLRYFRRKISVEPIFLIYMFIEIGDDPLLTQYLYRRFGNWSLTHDEIETNGCQGDYSNNSLQTLVSDVQERTAHFNMIYWICSAGPALFSVPLLGAFTDDIGRKNGLLIPCIGLSIMMLFSTAIVAFELPLWLFFVGAFINGLSGSAWTLTATSFAYVADISTRDERAVRLTIVEALCSFASAISSISIGALLESIGFLWSFFNCLILSIILIFYIVLCIKDTVQQESKFKFSTKTVIKYLKDNINVFRRKGVIRSYRRTKLALLLMVIFLLKFAYLPLPNIRTLFLMNTPFCWNPLPIGYYSFAFDLTLHIGSIVGVLFLKKLLHMPSLLIAVIGCMSGGAAYIMNGLATKEWILYALIPVSLLAQLPESMVRFSMSTAVSKDEHGALFAGIEIMDIIVCMISGAIANGVYAATVSFFPGFIFILFAFILSVSAVTITIFHIAVTLQKQAQAQAGAQGNRLLTRSSV